MRLRDIIRAIRDYPTARAELETTRLELRRTRQELEQGEQEQSSLRLTLEEQKDHTKFLSGKAEALQEALTEFCPKLSAPGELKRFYDTISPSLDESGFTLYRVAKELTGIDVPSCFPYEDNRGLFEETDRHSLLNWLIAVRFQAVDWDIIPGSPYESATLREVDTSTPEYQSFEKQLYEKVLERMGFQDILSPEQETVAAKEQVTELRLYSSLSGELADPENGHRETLDGSGLAAFRDVILRGIKDGQFSEEAEMGLMIYYDGPSAVDEKVISLFPSVEELDGVLCGAAVCQVRGKLTPGELEELKEYCHSQYNDAWGEEFRERARHTEYGDLYVSFYTDSSASILTQKELERVSAVVSRQMKRGDAR